MIMLTWHKWFHLSASAILTILSRIIVFLSIKQTTAVDWGIWGTSGGNLQNESSWIQHTDIYPFATFTLKYGFRREMYIPRGPIDMTQKITHSLGDIFRSVLLCWAKHRDFWVIAHLNNAKCVRLHTPEAPDAKWLGWQGTDDEMFCHKRVSMFPFPHCVLAVSERGVEEVCTCHRNRGEKSRPLKV